MMPSKQISQQLGSVLVLGIACLSSVACSGSDDASTQDSTTQTDGGNNTTTSSNAASNATTTGATTGSATTGASASTSSGTGGPSGAGGSSGNGNGNGTTAPGSTSGGGDTSSANSTEDTGSTGEAGATGTTGTTGGSVFPPGVTTVHIMIVGDSISAGPGCYKKYLLENLEANSYTNYEFVGEYDDDCGGGVKHSAVSCSTTTQWIQDTFTVPNCFGTDNFPGIATLVENHEPDLLMLQLGVNDVWSGSAPIEPILEHYATLITEARSKNPNIVVMVAQIHKIITENCENAASTTNAEALVMAVPDWALTVTTEESPVLVADLWTNSDAHESDDCVHPNDAGAQRMGLNWYNALSTILPH